MNMKAPLKVLRWKLFTNTITNRCCKNFCSYVLTGSNFILYLVSCFFEKLSCMRNIITLPWQRVYNFCGGLFSDNRSLGMGAWGQGCMDGRAGMRAQGWEHMVGSMGSRLGGWYYGNIRTVCCVGLVEWTRSNKNPWMALFLFIHYQTFFSGHKCLFALSNELISH